MRGRLSNPEERAVIEDALGDQGRRLRLPAQCYAAAAAAADDADDAADSDVAAVADDAAVDDADDAADVDARLLTLNGGNMVTGLVVVQVPGRSGWRVTLIAWAREVRPDEWELANARVITRDTYQTARVGLVGLVRGLPPGYSVSEAGTEYAHRFDLTRPRRADEAAWATLMPRPEGWVP